MPDRAHVTSVDAIKAFKSNLIVYLSKARPTLEEIGADVLRLRLWLQNEAVAHWEGEFRRRSRKLEDAQQALFSSRIANLRDPSSAEIIAVTRAKRAVDEAEVKLRTIKRWTRDFDSRVEPMAKQLAKLQTLLSEEMLHALTFLTRAIGSLDAYADVAPPAVGGDGGTAPAVSAPDAEKPAIAKEPNS